LTKTDGHDALITATGTFRRADTVVAGIGWTVASNSAKRHGAIKIAGAMHNLKTGVVDFFTA
jgi:hypothetical protein